MYFVDSLSDCPATERHRWLGLTCSGDCDTEANWSWLDGAEYDYTNWDLNATTADIPPRDNQPCGVMILDGTWHSQPCDTAQWKAICSRGMLNIRARRFTTHYFKLYNTMSLEQIQQGLICSSEWTLWICFTIADTFIIVRATCTQLSVKKKLSLLVHSFMAYC